MRAGEMIVGEEGASGLDRGGRILIWSWRKIVAGRGDCPLIAREFSLACGEDAAEVFITFCTCLRALAYASRRRLRVGCLGSPELTADERRLLALVAAAQADDRVRFEAHLHWLARAERRGALAIAARALGSAFGVHGLVLPLPAPVVPIFREGGAALRSLAPDSREERVRASAPQPASGS